jgi:hypothetical protein
MRKFVVAALAVLVQTAIETVSGAAGPLMISAAPAAKPQDDRAAVPPPAPLTDHAAQCPARVRKDGEFSAADAIASRPKVMGLSDQTNTAISVLYRGLTEDNLDALKAARASFLGSRILNKLAVAGMATTRIAELLHDQAMLQEARSLTEKSLARMRTNDAWVKPMKLAASSQLIGIKLLQGNAIGGKAGIALIREAIADNDQLTRDLQSGTTPSSVELRQKSWFNIVEGMPSELLTQSTLLLLIKDFESATPDDSSPLDRLKNRSILAGALIVLTGYQAKQDGKGSAQRARAIIAELSDQVKTWSDPLGQREQLEVLIGNMSGSWPTRFADESESCVIEAQLQIMLAKADLLLASDDAAVGDARQRLLDADRRLAGTPAYRRSAEPLLIASESFLQSSATAPADKAQELRKNAIAALAEAQLRVEKCFCAFDEAKIAKLRAQAGHDPL